MLKLYDFELSGNCFKVRLMMSILGLKYKTEVVEFYPGREHKTPAFLRINPMGQLPVLQDGEKPFETPRRYWFISLRCMTRRVNGIRSIAPTCLEISRSG